ncbi:TPA: hypothetical protein N0F65_003662 [Lagenidium giganteum]|uniref:Uncharacterized protein n=1 Tax=Lagenidium giganteum TaxID=4803 RepID=A0AAV2YJU4_9STRA|nr:TPA: hypothetical protein N0F65_003662 [Lagenidium giganteum]
MQGGVSSGSPKQASTTSTQSSKVVELPQGRICTSPVSVTATNAIASAELDVKPEENESHCVTSNPVAAVPAKDVKAEANDVKSDASVALPGIGEERDEDVKEEVKSESSSPRKLNRLRSRPSLQIKTSFDSHNPKSTQPYVFRLSDFFYKEIFGVHDIKQTDGMHQERVQNFLAVPYRLEQLFVFGIFLALDSFLYVFTYLPLRILFACGCAVTSSFHTRVFRRTHFYDLMVAVIIAVATSLLWKVDMSRVYHVIRGQAMIKLYVLFTMIEIFDRLFCSLGQDVLDSLYYTAKYQPRRVGRMSLDFAVSIVYVDIQFSLHETALDPCFITINVAINSSNTSLLTLLISNNFAELKSCVFKKFEEQNLFQVTCSDIVERFKLLLIIGLILLQSSAGDIAYGTTMVMVAEMIIDWLKHAFITKFNQIPPTAYSKFITILCRDLTGWKNEDTILDHTHHVSRRLGLVSLPLACVVLCMVGKALIDAPISFISPSGIAMTGAFFMCLAAFKALLSLVLMIYACRSGRLDDTRPKSPRAVRQLESIQKYRH